jgi:hypothetical protein
LQLFGQRAKAAGALSVTDITSSATVNELDGEICMVTCLHHRAHLEPRATVLDRATVWRRRGAGTATMDPRATCG